MKYFFAVISFLLSIVLISWFFQGNDFFMYKLFAPKYEQVRRETFEQTKSYNQGMIQELMAYQFEYIKADPAHKTALAAIILHRSADFPLDNMPLDLRNFINDIRQERNNAR